MTRKQNGSINIINRADASLGVNRFRGVSTNLCTRAGRITDADRTFGRNPSRKVHRVLDSGIRNDLSVFLLGGIRGLRVLINKSVVPNRNVRTILGAFIYSLPLS